MQTELERNVNDWLNKSVKTNNGVLNIDYLYIDYCDDFYFKIKEVLLKNGNTILNEEEFKDKVIYFLYKYSQHELS